MPRLLKCLVEDIAPTHPVGVLATDRFVEKAMFLLHEKFFIVDCWIFVISNSLPIHFWSIKREKTNFAVLNWEVWRSSKVDLFSINKYNVDRMNNIYPSPFYFSRFVFSFSEKLALRLARRRP